MKDIMLNLQVENLHKILRFPSSPENWVTERSCDRQLWRKRGDTGCFLRVLSPFWINRIWHIIHSYDAHIMQVIYFALLAPSIILRCRIIYDCKVTQLNTLIFSQKEEIGEARKFQSLIGRVLLVKGRDLEP